MSTRGRAGEARMRGSNQSSAASAQTTTTSTSLAPGATAGAGAGIGAPPAPHQHTPPGMSHHHADGVTYVNATPVDAPGGGVGVMSAESDQVFGGDDEIASFGSSSAGGDSHFSSHHSSAAPSRDSGRLHRGGPGVAAPGLGGAGGPTEPVRVEGQVVLTSVSQCINYLGFSIFQGYLWTVCGIIFAAECMEILVLSYLADCVAEDWNLSTFEEASLSSMVFMGELAGALVWGWVGDVYGRKPAVIGSTFCMATGGLLSAFATNYSSLLTFRMIVGLGIGGGNIAYDLFAEYCPKQSRGRALASFAVWWAFGAAYANAVAWGYLATSGWRTMLMLVAIPQLLAFLLCLQIAESPKWLVQAQRPREAHACLRRLARANKIPLPAVQLKPPSHLPESPFSAYATLLQPNHLRQTLFLAVLWVTMDLGYYGTWMYITNLADLGGCSFIFWMLLLAAGAECLGNVTLFPFLDTQGRIRCGTIAMIGLVCALVLLAPTWKTDGELTIFSLICRIFSGAASSVVYMITPEIYPTSMRATVHSFFYICGRFGSFTAPYLVDSGWPNAAIALTLCAAVCVEMAALNQLPETARKDLPDEYDEVAGGGPPSPGTDNRFPSQAHQATGRNGVAGHASDADSSSTSDVVGLLSDVYHSDDALSLESDSVDHADYLR